MKKNTIKVVGTVATILLFVTGCGKVPKLENGQDAVVTLNGNNISVDTLYNEMKEKYALSVLLDLVDTQILNEKYKDTQDMKDEIESQINYLLAYYGSESNLIQNIYQETGIDTIEKLKEYLSLQQKQNLALEDYSKSIVTEKEINKFYDEKIFGDISASHILIAPDVSDNATDAEKTAANEEALKKANEVISKLKNGEKFETLAKEYSDDESNASNGGKLNDFVHGDMVEEFENAAKELEVGKYTTTPVKTTYGYHIIYKNSQKEKPELKTVKDDIIDEIATDKRNNDASLQITALEELRKDNKVEIQDDSLKKQYENYLDYMKNLLKK